ncbi:hypothetical protein QE152_g34917 [Popillia japonica]|uniref:Uncharacterized protein n=1 Tax=Popillia japonica TaxID=7064 RepID=A0AAW1IS65_POPJA
MCNTQFLFQMEQIGVFGKFSTIEKFILSFYLKKSGQGSSGFYLRGLGLVVLIQTTYINSLFIVAEDQYNTKPALRYKTASQQIF